MQKYFFYILSTVVILAVSCKKNANRITDDPDAVSPTDFYFSYDCRLGNDSCHMFGKANWDTTNSYDNYKVNFEQDIDGYFSAPGVREFYIHVPSFTYESEVHLPLSIHAPLDRFFLRLQYTDSVKVSDLMALKNTNIIYTAPVLTYPNIEWDGGGPGGDTFYESYTFPMNSSENENITPDYYFKINDIKYYGTYSTINNQRSYKLYSMEGTFKMIGYEFMYDRTTSSSPGTYKVYYSNGKFRLPITIDI